MKPSGAARSDAWWDLVWWSLLLVSAIFLGTAVLRDVPGAYAAVLKQSVVTGTFTPSHSECTRECTYHGSFESTDGSIRLGAARMNEPLLSLPRGEPVAAVWPLGEAPQVYLASGSRAWLELSLILAGSAAALVVAPVRIFRIVRSITHT